MASHYLFDVEFCNPASGWEKGQVEKNVQDARRRLWRVASRRPNEWLERRCKELWREIPHQSEPGTGADAWEAETASLMPSPPPFDGFVEYVKRVSPTCLVHLERNRYRRQRPSPIDLLACVFTQTALLSPQRVKSFASMRGSLIDPIAGRDERFTTGGIIWRLFSKKPGASRNGAPFADLPDAFRRLQQHLLKHPGGDREMVDILALVLQHDEQAVLCAVELALNDSDGKNPYPEPAAQADRRQIVCAAQTWTRRKH